MTSMKNWRSFLQQDSILAGILMAISTTALVMLVYVLLREIFPDVSTIRYLRRQSFMLAGIFVNLFSFRYFMLSKKLDQTGRGILLAMFVMTVSYFVFFHNQQD